MNLKSLLLVSSLFTFLTGSAIAQTSAGNCFFIDYDSWNAGLSKPPVYIDCGTSNLFNTGNELTMEVWIRAYNSTWNQKIMGKCSNTFDNGYVMAFELGKNYSEIWNPLNNAVKDGSSPIDSAWVHLATTFASGGQMIAYINGIQVGVIPLTGNAISTSLNPFIIGMAPWDLISLQTFGSIDEVRIWSVARTAAEINETMFKHLQGNETGLVAYYNFNQTTTSTVNDITGNANNGTVNAAATPYWSWQSSYAPVADDRMYPMADVNAVWFGKDPVQYNFASTTNGLSLIASIQSKHFDYAVYGHNDSIDVSTTYLPSIASFDFKRTSREWYFCKGGTIATDMYFNLDSAAGGGSALLHNQPVQYYTLLARDSDNQAYAPVAAAASILGGGAIIKFSNINLENKFYCIGVGSTQIASVHDADDWVHEISVFPNPSNDKITITHAENADITIYNLLGISVKRIRAYAESVTMDVSKYESGIYFIQIRKSNSFITKRILIQK